MRLIFYFLATLCLCMLLNTQSLRAQPSGFVYTPTIFSGTLLGQVELDDSPAPVGTWIAAFDSAGNCAGASEVILFEGITYANLNIFGDDATTDTIDEGMTETDVFTLLLYDPAQEQVLVYSENGQTVQLDGWINNNGAPIPAYSDPSRVFSFSSESIALEVAYVETASPTCAGDANGSIAITAEGFFPPFSFVWNTGATGSTLTGIGDGSYTCTVTDALGQVFTFGPVSLQEPSPLLLEVADGLDTCNAGLGLLAAVVDGGTPPYNYFWTHGEEGELVQNLSEGIYTLQVTDANNCSISANATVQASPGPDIIWQKEGPFCFGGEDGSIEIETEGGVPPFSWLWSTGEDSGSIQDLPAGTYSLTVTDAYGCTFVSQEQLLQPDSLAVSFEVEPATGLSGGNVFTTVIGGTPPFFYEWGDPVWQTTANLLQIEMGTYTLTVTDAAECILVDSVQVPLEVSTTWDGWEEKARLFPNPSAGEFVFFELGGNPPPLGRIEIYNIDGRFIGVFPVSKHGERYQASILSIPAGVYQVFFPELKKSLPELWIVNE